MLGRSDGVLYVPIHSSPRQLFNSFYRNPGGIRFGSAEIYEVFDSYFSSQNAEHVVLDYLAVGQKTDGGADDRVVLFIKLPPGQDLSPSFEARIKSEIRSRRSPRHVPARVLPFILINVAIAITNFPPQIIQVPDIPYTLNGKRVEVLVKKVRSDLVCRVQVEKCRRR